MRTARVPQTGRIHDDVRLTLIGMIRVWPKDVDKPGWLLCDGKAVPRDSFPRLFGKIGTLYGVGDGTTTFNVPDMRGRIPLGKDNLGGSAASRVTDASQADLELSFHTQTAVDDSAETITLTGHGLTTGDPVLYDVDGGTDDIGLTDATTYFVNVLDADTVSLHLNKRDAMADDDRIDLTDGSGGETHLLTRKGNGTQGSTMGGLGGEERHAVTVAEMGTHAHTERGSNGGGGQVSLFANSGFCNLTDGPTDEDGGAGTPHDNVAPYMTCAFWIKY